MNLMKHTVKAACPHDCPDACGVLITVEDGRATRIQGDAEHPVTRGFLCAKVAKYLHRVYSPERVLYPVKRIADKTRAYAILSQSQIRASGKEFPGTRLSTPLLRDFARSLASLEVRRFCLTPMVALWVL